MIKHKSYRLLWGIGFAVFLIAISFFSSAAQSKDKLTIVNVPKKFQSRLIERINQFVEYDRTRQYEKQYELYLPKFAKLIFIAKDKEEYANIFLEAGESRGRMIEFKPKTLVMVEDDVYGKVCLIYWCIADRARRLWIRDPGSGPAAAHRQRRCGLSPLAYLHHRSRSRANHA